MMPRRRFDEPDSTTSYSLHLLLVTGSFWFLTVLVAIVFGLGTMI